MNFYEAQDAAHRRTKWLFVYFVLAVVGIVISLYFVILLGLYFGGFSNVSLWMPNVLMNTALIGCALIVCGSVFKSLQLSGGGDVVARDMGARQIDPNTSDREEKRLVNIVEEMAIASGVPVPQVWVMDDEMSINAFAAGTDPGNAVVCMSRGSLQYLNRAELQGVVAHEFSHILNGDMKMNMRIMGWIFGIMMISLIGRVLMDAIYFTGGSRSRDKNSGNLGIFILVVGIGLMIVGSIGVVFARMIQAAISRQREYLADASAVQFTREPASIAGALKKIGGMGERMHASKAGEASHMFFSDAGLFSFGMATHPPLDVRIRAVEPDWDGEFSDVELDKIGSLPPRRSQMPARRPSAGMAAGLAGAAVASSRPTVPPPIPQARDVGESDFTQLATGQQIMKSLDASWIEACHQRESAQALVLGMLLAQDAELHASELSFLTEKLGEDASQLAESWSKKLLGLHSSKKIALIDLCIPSLRNLSPGEYTRFLDVSRWLISSDGQVDLFEFMLQKVVERHLQSHFNPRGHQKVKYRRIEDLMVEASIIVTTISSMSAEGEIAEVFASATQGWSQMKLMEPADCGLQSIDAAVQKFDLASPLVKRQLIQMCASAVMFDGEIHSREAEMLRAVADAMGCAMPPFVANAHLGDE